MAGFVAGLTTEEWAQNMPGAVEDTACWEIYLLDLSLGLGLLGLGLANEERLVGVGLGNSGKLLKLLILGHLSRHLAHG